jgi:acetyl-CoA decarbonylase/synthase complex subunit delta
LAKQLNILLQNDGLPLENVLIDPTVGGLGYGLEYTYSVMERMRIAALQQNDQLLALPFICHLGKEIWKAKEARQSQTEAPELGRDERGIFMEISAGVSLLLAGANVLVLGHPHSLAWLQKFIDHMYGPDSAEK